MKALAILLFITIAGYCDAQSVIQFKYDAAGNQIFRGLETIQNMVQNKQVEQPIAINEEFTKNKEEEKFWSNIRIYPVPVKDVLTIDWTDEIDTLVGYISLYEHSTIHWKFQQKNIPNINKQVSIDMTGYYMGVYIVRFQLKDGRAYSKNIIKQ